VLTVITPVFTSRRAERFAQLLDEAAGARRHHVRSAADSDLTEMVAISQRVSAVPLVVEVDPEFRTGLRASLMARIEREGIGATSTSTEADEPSRRRLSQLIPSTRTRGAMVVTLIAGTLAASGVSAASGDAIPGDTLYGVKRSTERAQLAFAGSDISKGQLYFEFAKVRLAEAGAVGGNAARLAPVLDDMDADMRHGSRLLTGAAVQRNDAAGLDAIRQFAGQQRPTLQSMVNRLGGPAKRRAAESLALLDKIDQRAEGLHSTIKCPGQKVPTDELGAVPVLCAAASPQQENVPGTTAGTAPGTTPPTTAPVPPQAANEPATVPSVEAESSETPDVDRPSEADDGMIDKIGRVLGNIFD
jgi:hypothetical protein